MQKSRRQFIWGITATAFIVAVITYRMVKIVRKQEQKRVLAQSVTPRVVWDIELPAGEFVGDLSQVGDYMVYALPDDKVEGAWVTLARQLGRGIITKHEAANPNNSALPNPLIIGQSILGKKEFRIEREGNRSVVAQYNIATGARGLIARLPSNCDNFTTTQRLPQNFFALEGLCSMPGEGKQPFKRVMVVDFETRRLTYVSGILAKNMRFIAFK